MVGVTPQVTLQGKTGDGSRHSFTYSTNHENSTEKPQRRKTLTERENVTLREEVRDWGSLNDWPLQWDESIEEFIEYDREARKTSQVYENQATGETSTNPVSHRFQPQYREMQYARFNDLLREAQDRHSVVHTTLIGLTASSTPDGEQLAPVDHWHDLDRSNDAVKQAIRRIKDQLGDAVAIEFVEAHPGGGTNDGYLHKHPVIISGQRVSDTQVRKILNAHVNNSPHAKAEAHDLDQAVTRNRVSQRKDADLATENVIGNLPAYLTSYLLDYGKNLEDLPESQRAGAAVLWATGAQSIRPGATAQEWMQRDQEDQETAEEWEMVGVERDGEFIPSDDHSGGVSTFTTGTGPPGPPGPSR